MRKKATALHRSEAMGMSRMGPAAPLPLRRRDSFEAFLRSVPTPRHSRQTHDTHCIAEQNALYHGTHMQQLWKAAALWHPQPAPPPPLRRRLAPRRLRRPDQRTASALQRWPALSAIAMPESRVAVY